MTTWPVSRPIAEAPRDGTRVLLGPAHVVGFWSTWNNHWTDGRSDRSFDHVCLTPQPTCWWPLPPTGDAAGAGPGGGR